MKDTNKVIEIGHLVKDAELKSLSDDFGVIQFTIGVNTTKKSGDKFVDEGNFFTVKKYGKKQEKLASMLTKGKQVCVEGFLHQDRWEKDGQKNSMIVIYAENLQLLGGGNLPQSHETYQDGDFQEDIPGGEDIPF